MGDQKVHRVADAVSASASSTTASNNEKECKAANEKGCSSGLREGHSNCLSPLLAARDRTLTASSVSSEESDLHEESDDDNSDEKDPHATSEHENMGCKRRSQPFGLGNTQKTEPWMQRAWVLHFTVGFSVLLYSVWRNGGYSKYIPVDPIHSSEISGVEALGQCHKVFVNVMASSREEDGAVVCCPSNDSLTTNQSTPTIFDLCPPSPETEAWFFLLGRLSKFPDAWLIPLFPLLLRIGFRTYQTMLENGHLVLDTTFGVYSFRRLVFYFSLMQFRGWVLYVALNGIEDNILNRDESQGSCWYHDWVQPAQSFCYGRKFDFSDHIVLYYAQLLPIALLEYLHSIHRPYWPFRCFRRLALPALLTAGTVYLYFITYIGVYKTAAYFHTPSEILAGFAVSLLAQLPLYSLQCSNGSKMITSLREYFFGPKSKVLLQ